MYLGLNPTWSDAQINEVKNYAGGEQAYSNMVDWAASNLDQQSITDKNINRKAKEIGLKIQEEDGIGNAVSVIKRIEKKLL